MSIAVCEFDCRVAASEKPPLQQVCIPVDRLTCIKAAMSKGVPLHPIETYLDWLEATVGPVAVLSYGVGNPFGHPAAEIVDSLEQAGVTVHRTADGDVVVPFGVGQPVSSSAALAQRRPKVHGVPRLA